MDKESKIKQKEDEAMDIPYDEEAKCEKCGRTGQNTLEKEEFSLVGNSPETAETHFVVCKCGNELYEIEDLNDEVED